MEEILEELKEIKELLHIIASNTEQNADLRVKKFIGSLDEALQSTVCDTLQSFDKK